MRSWQSSRLRSRAIRHRSASRVGLVRAVIEDPGSLPADITHSTDDPLAFGARVIVAVAPGVLRSLPDSLPELEFYDSISTLTNRVAIYARSSPDCPVSADEQIEHLRNVAAERGWTVTHVFSDRPTIGEEKSGSPSRRIGADRGDPVGHRSACTDLVHRSELGNPSSIWSGSWRPAGSAVCRCGWTTRGFDTATSNGLSLFDLSTMMASHLRQSRRDRILRGQAAARSLSIRFGTSTDRQAEGGEGQAVPGGR